MIWSTRCDSARRLNFDSTWSAGVHGFGRERAAVEPAGAEPHHLLLAVDDLERQIGRTCTTIMCSELVPMSMAARRMSPLPL